MAFLRVVLLIVIIETWVVPAFGQEDEAIPNIDLLVNALVHPDSSIRQAVTVRLKEAGPAAASPLAELLRTGDLAEAVSAAGVLAEIDEIARDEVRAALVAMLGISQIEDWRWSLAASVLGEIDPQRAGLLDLFVTRLRSNSPLVHYASIQAITAISQGVPGAKPDQLAKARSGLLELLERGRLPLTEILLPRSSRSGGRVSFRAQTPWLDDFAILNALQTAGLAESRLIALLSQRAQPGRNERVQLAAAKLLLRLGADGERLAAEVLSRLIGNRYSTVRSDAIKLATQLGPDGHRAVAVMIDVLWSPEAELREHAATALGNMGALAEQALPSLRTALALEKARGVSGKRVARVMEAAIAKIAAKSAESP